MGDLIRTHLVRLWKTPVYRAALLVMLPCGLALCNSATGDYQAGTTAAGLWGQPLCGFGLLSGFVLAAVCSLFFGAEYADGTIRNKLIAGHGRASIYLATLATSLLAALGLYAVYLLAWAPRIPWMLRNFPAPAPKALALCLAGTVLLVASQCSVCVMLCMLVQRRAVLAVALLLLMVLLLFASFQAQDAYETATGGGMQLFIDEAGRQQWVFHEPGTAGALTAFLYDALPVCQAWRYMELEATPRMLACSAALTALTTALGLILFQRKDIK